MIIEFKRFNLSNNNFCILYTWKYFIFNSRTILFFNCNESSALHNIKISSTLRYDNKIVLGYEDGLVLIFEQEKRQIVKEKKLLHRSKSIKYENDMELEFEPKEIKFIGIKYNWDKINEYRDEINYRI